MAAQGQLSKTECAGWWPWQHKPKCPARRQHRGAPLINQYQTQELTATAVCMAELPPLLAQAQLHHQCPRLCMHTVWHAEQGRALLSRTAFRRLCVASSLTSHYRYLVFLYYYYYTSTNCSMRRTASTDVPSAITHAAAAAAQARRVAQTAARPAAHACCGDKTPRALQPQETV